MAKADKSTILRRTQDVLRLLLAGAEFEDIRQYASDQGWTLSDRQLRRYQEQAYRRVAVATHRDATQLLGRHLMQRRALYARALKTEDLRTALQVLRDEAALEGLYPNKTIAPTLQHEQIPYEGSAGPPLTREERFRRLLAAEEAEDQMELRLLEQTTPILCYRMPDTMMPRQMLNVLTLLYVADQLDHASMFFMALWRSVLDDDSDDCWDFIGSCHAFRFRIEHDGWKQFTQSIGADAGKLVAANHQGSLMEQFADRIYKLAPTDDEFVASLKALGRPTEDLPSADGIARNWRWLLGHALRS